MELQLQMLHFVFYTIFRPVRDGRVRQVRLLQLHAPEADLPRASAGTLRPARQTRRQRRRRREAAQQVPFQGQRQVWLLFMLKKRSQTHSAEVNIHLYNKKECSKYLLQKIGEFVVVFVVIFFDDSKLDCIFIV